MMHIAMQNCDKVHRGDVTMSSRRINILFLMSSNVTALLQTISTNPLPTPALLIPPISSVAEWTDKIICATKPMNLVYKIKNLWPEIKIHVHHIYTEFAVNKEAEEPKAGVGLNKGVYRHCPKHK